MVRGDTQESADVAEQSSGGGGEVETKVFDYSGYKGNEPVWYVAVEGGEQQGPYTTDQMREYLQAGNITAETYVWREGLEDWKLVSEVAEISGAPKESSGAVQGAAAAAAVPVTAATATAPAEGSGPFGAPAHSETSGGLFDSAPSTGGGGLFDAAPAGDVGGGGLFGAGGGQDSPGDVFSSAAETSTGGLFSADQNAAAATKDGGGLFDGPAVTGTGGDLFASTDSDDDGGGGIFASTEAQSASPRVSAAQAMTGQRNENSVLFSLSNLQALASDSADATPSGGEIGGFGGGMAGMAAPAGEASGLIDIRAMASSLTAEAEKADDVDEMLSLGGGGFASTLGAPVLTAAKPAGLSMGMKIGIGAGVVALLIGVVIAVVMLAQKDTSAQDEKIAMLMKQIEAMKSQGASAEDIMKARQELEKTQEQKRQIKSGDVVAMKDDGSSADNNEADDQSDSKSSRGSSSSKSKKKSGSSSESGSVASSSSGSSSKKESASSLLDDTPKSADSPAPKKKSTSALDDLLGGAAKPKKKAAESSSGGGDKLTRQQVMSGMGAVAGSVKRCGAGKTGTFKIKAKIEPNGRVSQAQAVGQFSGTPAGTCAANAVKRARFPQSSTATNVTFPFKI